MEWFALRVKPRTERVVAAMLDGKGYERLLPLHMERRRWSDRITTVEAPVFAGYVFCRFDVQKRLPILTTPGVLSVVGIGKAPYPIDDAEIESIRVLSASGLAVEPHAFLHEGQRIEIVAGPLTGATGVLMSVKGRDRLIVSVTLLQRSVSVEVPQSCAWPIGA
ncbi:MAG TPA: UpxY family transcription antiterminator [Luteitalea sp.]|nr:UpxY family transcription antiterminator [Luteitalea sp.]